MQFISDNKWGIPFIYKNPLKSKYVQFLGYDEINRLETDYEDRTIHFFKEDYKFDIVYNEPEKHIKKLARFASLLTPDFSMYIDLPLALQIHSVFMNRWCGAYWQDCGLTVIPTVSWSTRESYEFCFSGIEKGSVVAVSTLGVLKEERLFMDGYNEMLSIIEPEFIYCFGKPFDNMGGEIYFIDYKKTMGRK